MSESHDEHGERLERSYMTAIDDALDALDVYYAALAAGDAPAATKARQHARRAWAAFGELIINRADHRTAHLLLDQLRQVDALMHPEREHETDHGHDETGRP